MRKVDLHIHTNASSDGEHTPREIFLMAEKINLCAISFADHNNINNIKEGMKFSEKFKIEFIPSVEINTVSENRDIHLLAYFIDPDNKNLNDWLEEILEKKKIQAYGRYKKLVELGFKLNYEDVLKFSYGGIPTGASYLKAIMLHPENLSDPRLAPYINGDRSDSPYLNFYLDYLRLGKPAAYPIEITKTEEAIERVREMKAIPVIAHPTDIPESMIKRFIKYGLLGLEVFCSYHDVEKIRFYGKIAKRYNLIMTAGSDFHGRTIKPNVKLGGIKGNSYRIVEKLKEIKKKL